MDNTTPTATEYIEHLHTLIKHLPEAVTAFITPLDAIQHRLSALDGRTCTGHAHWRDKNASDKTPKLYILHGTDKGCPVHGKPPAGERTRSYIGNKPDKISEALAAIERQTEHLQLRKDYGHLVGTVRFTTHQIETLYRHLGQTPPTREESNTPTSNESP